MAEEPVVSCAVVNGFGRLLDARGICFDALLASASLQRADVADEDGTVPLLTFARLFERAAEEARDEALGLHLAATLDPGYTGVHGYASMYAPTVRDSIKTMARYGRLLISMNTCEYAEVDGVGIGTWTFAGDRMQLRQYSDFIAARIVYRLRLALGENWVPLYFDLEHPEPDDIAPFVQVFGDDLRFDQPLNRIGVRAEDLDCEMPKSDPRLWQLLKELGETLLSTSKTEMGVMQRVQREILELIQEDRVSVEEIARRLGKSVRSLQRDLEESGTSFAAILDQTRSELAQRYLANTKLNITQIAYLLGFSELSAFTRATNRWFGESPRSLRHRLLTGE